MKKPKTTTYSWERLTAIPALFSLVLLLGNGCTPAPWRGKYTAPAGNNCYLLESVEIHGDATADVKYEALRDPANFPMEFNEADSILIIRELNKEWGFKWNGGDTLFEVSNMDPYCYLVREK